MAQSTHECNSENTPQNSERLNPPGMASDRSGSQASLVELHPPASHRGLSWVLVARVSPRVSTQTGVSEGVSHGVSLGPCGALVPRVSPSKSVPYTPGTWKILRAREGPCPDSPDPPIFHRINSSGGGVFPKFVGRVCNFG